MSHSVRLSRFREALVLVLVLGAFLVQPRSAQAQTVTEFQVGAPFYSRDALCFSNGSGLRGAEGPLGALARKGGACTGMSAIVGAFLQNARFSKSSSPANADFAARAEVVQRLARAGCSQRLLIPDQPHLHSACAASGNPQLLMNASVQENALRVLSDILDRSAELALNPKSPREQARADQQEYERVWRELTAGRPSLLVIRFHSDWTPSGLPHTVLVTGIRSVRDDSGARRWILSVYDSNQNADDPSSVQEIVVPWLLDGSSPDPRATPTLYSAKWDGITVIPLQAGVVAHSLERPSPQGSRLERCCSIVRRFRVFFDSAEGAACAGTGTAGDWADLP